MQLTHPPIGSRNTATRDYAVNLAGKLEENEILVDITLSTSDEDYLTVSPGEINDSEISGLDICGNTITIEPNRGVLYTVTTEQDTVTSRSESIFIQFQGDTGTQDTLEITQPIVSTLRT